MEIDETDGSVVKKEDAAKYAEERDRTAKEIYGITEDGKINVPKAPEIPDYLLPDISMENALKEKNFDSDLGE
jgi:hypothetical protein